MVATPISIRFHSAVLERLRQSAASHQVSLSAHAESLVDEALRLRSHPGIVFRPGPTGLRAGLTNGPDVWEVINAIQTSPIRSEKAIAAVAESMDLTMTQVHAAISYYADFPDEIDGRITANNQAAEAASRTWKARQRIVA